MSRKHELVEEEIELIRDYNSDSQDTHRDEDEDGSSVSLLAGRSHTRQSWLRHFISLTYLIPRQFRKSYSTPRKPRKTHFTSHRTFLPRSLLRKSALLTYVFLAAISGLVIISGVFYPSYTYLPEHYQELQRRVQSSLEPGRGNSGKEKVFIAASIYDEGGELASGAWAKNILDLIDLLGPENTYLSIYENDAGTEAKNALTLLREKVPCANNLTFEHLPVDAVPSITLPDGTQRVKRIAYLAEVRNRALRPLENTSVKYDKLLYLNDVVFNPLDIIQLIFSTNKGESGRAEYRAACAVDFINPFKFYDTFATRDSEGYRMGVIFFPWFSPGGEAHSRQQVLNGDDAIQVRSCWGGAVSFDAKFFQSSAKELDVVTAGSQSPLSLTAPARFRAEYDMYWDASECCLIHADIQSPHPNNSGIYMNPYVRVAYGTRTLSWLKFTRRFERLYSPIQFLIDVCFGNPTFNERRDEQPWQETKEVVWVPNRKSPNGGSFETVPRLGNHAGFCGRRKLPVMKEHLTTGERNWEFVPVPTSS